MCVASSSAHHRWVQHTIACGNCRGWRARAVRASRKSWVNRKLAWLARLLWLGTRYVGTDRWLSRWNPTKVTGAGRARYNAREVTQALLPECWALLRGRWHHRRDESTKISCFIQESGGITAITTMTYMDGPSVPAETRVLCFAEESETAESRRDGTTQVSILRQESSSATRLHPWDGFRESCPLQDP